MSNSSFSQSEDEFVSCGSLSSLTWSLCLSWMLLQGCLPIQILFFVLTQIYFPLATISLHYIRTSSTFTCNPLCDHHGWIPKIILHQPLQRDFTLPILHQHVSYSLRGIPHLL